MNELRCAYLGPAGTFTEEAGLHYFPAAAELIPVDSIEGIFKGVREGLFDRGIVPAENSLEGPVNITMDLLFWDKEATIVGEEILPIRHFLIASCGVKLGEIKKVYSHPQAVAQTAAFLHRYLPGAEIHYTASTARAAGLIKGSSDSGLIGSSRISQLYNLEILLGDLQDAAANFTRFLIISQNGSCSRGGDRQVTENVGETGDRVTSIKSQELESGVKGKDLGNSGDPGIDGELESGGKRKDLGNSGIPGIDGELEISEDYKTSIICAPEVNRAGVLYELLGHLARAEINLIRIESRPTRRQLGEYLFYIDFIGHYLDPPVKEALEGVGSHSAVFRLSGSYLRADREEKAGIVKTDRQQDDIQRMEREVEEKKSMRREKSRRKRV